MPIVSAANAEIVHKIVFVGPEGSGKKTTVQCVHRFTKADQRGPLSRVSTRFAPGIAIDFFTLRIGRIRGFNTKILLCTAPGRKDADKVRRIMLRRADCVIFVADCQIERLSSNLTSLYSLRENRRDAADSFESPPAVVYQFNKIDLPDVVEPARLAEILITGDTPYFGTSALDGTGIYEPLRAAVKLTMSRIESPRAQEVEPFSSAERLRRKNARNSLTALTRGVSSGRS